VIDRLRIGVLGLGSRWGRYHAALDALRSRVAVRAVWDPRSVRANWVARDLRCAAAGGVLELIERDDVDAVLLLSAGWHGLWPVEAAVRAGKPVFCAAPLAADDAHVDFLRDLIHHAGSNVFLASETVHAPAVDGLRDVLARRLGPARLVFGAWSAAGGRPFSAERVLPSMIEVCVRLFGFEPEGVHAVAPPVPGLTTARLDFGEGRAALLCLYAGKRSACRWRVIAENGEASAELPAVLRWRDADGLHAFRPTPRSLPKTLLEKFLDALGDGKPPIPSINDAHRGLVWARGIQRGRC
jgi:predicted dehydrogenase